MNHDPVTARALEVRPKPGETDDRMIRRFMKTVRNSGHLKEVVARTSYENPSDKARRERRQRDRNRRIGNLGDK